ncbi:hypothetical protein [Actinospica robiniae]|uniref:hypothetical protein n=1 Tax=Actinospica robiniae TaxID=304901 RepID=UPI0003FFD47B
MISAYGPGVARQLVGKSMAVLAAISVLIGGRWAAFSVQGLGTPSSAVARSTSHDALWLGHSWVDGRENEADAAALALQLRGTGITDVFVHVGPLNDDGTLDPAKAPRAEWFVDQIRTSIPSVRVQAWLGDEVEPVGAMNLEDPAVRAHIVASARAVMARGFGGVHLDLEPIGDADPGYLALLSAVEPVVHAAGGVLSVSGEQVEPVPGMRWAMEAVAGRDAWWSVGYLHQVAERVDQIALMTYDTELWSESAYAGYVRDETERALAAVPKNVALLIGLPAYHDMHSLGHSSSAETVGAALRGVKLALPDGTPTDRRFGVALYVDFAATPADWSAYDSQWAPTADTLLAGRSPGPIF